MEILIYLITYLIAIAITTAVLAASLFLVEDIQSSSFKEFGAGPTLARCAGLCIGQSLRSLPAGWAVGRSGEAPEGAKP